MMDNYRVIINPLVTEKTNMARTEGGKYCFLVDMKANKRTISKTLEGLYEVKVKKCNTLIYKGKKYRNRYGVSYSSRYKKAVIELHKGYKFDFYEGI